MIDDCRWVTSPTFNRIYMHLEKGKRKVTTLVMVKDGNKLLLGMKKRGFGNGKWNGFGGKVEVGESVEEGAKRELFEESGLRAKNLVKIGVNEFSWKGNEDAILEVNIFKTTDVEGNLIETEEMLPKWFFLDEIPFKEMWIDDMYWVPLFLEGKNFKGKFIFDENDKILSYSLKEV